MMISNEESVGNEGGKRQFQEEAAKGLVSPLIDAIRNSPDDSFRKLKQDLRSELTEASITGSIFSIVVGIIMIYLIGAQVGEQAMHCLFHVLLDQRSGALGSGLEHNGGITVLIA